MKNNLDVVSSRPRRRSPNLPQPERATTSTNQSPRFRSSFSSFSYSATREMSTITSPVCFHKRDERGEERSNAGARRAKSDKARQLTLTFARAGNRGSSCSRRARSTTVRAFICQLHSLWTTSVHDEFWILTWRKDTLLLPRSAGKEEAREEWRKDRQGRRGKRRLGSKGAKEDEGLEIPGKKSKLQVFVETLDW